MSGKSYYGTIQVTNDHEIIEEDGNDVNNGNETSPLLTSTATGSKDNNNSTTTHKQKSSIGIQTDPSYITQLYHNILKHWTLLTFNWISPLLLIGNTQNQLNVNDLELLPLPTDCETNVVYETFLKCWNDELEKARLSNNERGCKSTKKCNNDNNNNATDDILSDIEQEFINQTTDSSSSSSNNNILYNPNAYQPSLIKALYHAFGHDFVRAGLLKLIHDTNLFVGPQVLNRLIRFLRNKDAPLSYGITLMFIGTYSFLWFFVCLDMYIQGVALILYVTPSLSISHFLFHPHHFIYILHTYLLHHTI